MNTIKSTTFALLMIFSLVFVGQAEAKQHHKHSKSQKHASHSKHRSSAHGQKQTKQKNTHHNKKQRSTAQKVNNKTAQTFQKKGNNNAQANISPSAIKHIQDRHWYNASQVANTSHFSHSMTDQKLSQLAAKTINQGSQRPSTHGQGRSTYQYRFNKPIGTTTSGQTAHSLRVVTDAQNNVITAFPVK